MVYPVTYVQQHEATYIVWRVDHKLWSTNIYIGVCRTIHGNTCKAWRVDHKNIYVEQYMEAEVDPHFIMQRIRFLVTHSVCRRVILAQV